MGESTHLNNKCECATKPIYNDKMQVNELALVEDVKVQHQ